jgi:hypothetical protein
VKSAVLNASPLIILARAGYLDLVPKLLSPVVIPRAVATEINAGPATDPAVQFLSRPSWLSVVDLAPALSPLASWHLGQDESEVLEYARRNPGIVAVLDDKAARRAARTLEILVTGTLGIVVSAADMKLVPSLSAAIDAVRESGLYVDSATVSRLLIN